MLKKIALRFANSVWNEKNLDVIDELVAQDAVIHSTLGNLFGPEEMRKMVKAWLRGFPDLSVTNINLAAEGEVVMIHWQAEGTHRGEFKEIPASGKPVSYRGVTVYRIHGGKIVEYWAYLNMHQLLAQISG